jgi:hypothetical protein
MALTLFESWAYRNLVQRYTATQPKSGSESSQLSSGRISSYPETANPSQITPMKPDQEKKYKIAQLGKQFFASSSLVAN